MTRDYNALTVTRQFLEENVPRGGLCIDATAGRGRDTAYLCGLVGEAGRVLAFDIQEEAVESTRELLQSRGLDGIGQVVLDSHCHMRRYAEPGTVDAIVFNLGWLPGGDHSVFTRPQTSIAAIETGLGLLKVGGVMTLCIYYGKDTGYEERDALLRYLPGIDSKGYTVLLAQFCNRPNDPPIPVMITRESQ